MLLEDMVCPNCGEEGTLDLLGDVAFSTCHPNIYINSIWRSSRMMSKMTVMKMTAMKMSTIFAVTA